MRDFKQSQAVGVVLLPDEVMSSFAIHLNQQQIEAGADADIVLNQKDCLPHIPLAMGGLELSKLEKAKKAVDYLGQRFNPLSLRAIKYETFRTPTDVILSRIVLGVTGDLFKLHSLVLNVFKGMLFFTKLKAEMFFTPPKVENFSLSWIQEFRVSSSFENFRPYITVGLGFLPDLIIYEPLPFFAKKIALCHLGNYCVCKKILHCVEF